MKDLNVEQPKTESTFLDKLKSLGPGAIVAAGIIGPGTVTTVSVVGASYKYEAIWVLILACLIAYFYQEPALRITLHKKKGIVEGVREHISPFAAVFMFLAVFCGAIAFQAGNFIGAGLALDYFVPGIGVTTWSAIMAAMALIIAWIGVYRILEHTTEVLVGLMVLAFLITAFASGPSIGSIVTEGFSFNIPGGDYWLLAALVATTTPPNTVLALSVFTKHKHIVDLSKSYSHKINDSRFDLRVNLIILAIITISIVIAAGTVIHPKGIEIQSAKDMAVQLTPFLGRFAGVLFALGLWAAAFTSGLYQISLQPPLMNQAFGWKDDNRTRRSRGVMLVAGIAPIVIIYLFGSAPVTLIVTAQALNALALPLVAGLILVLCNREGFLGSMTNNLRQNIAYVIVTAIVSFLAIRVFLNLFGII